VVVLDQQEVDVLILVEQKLRVAHWTTVNDHQIDDDSQWVEAEMAPLTNCHKEMIDFVVGRFQPETPDWKQVNTAEVVEDCAKSHDLETRKSDVQDKNEQQVVVVKCNQPHGSSKES
jgi:hypothetical protein